MPKFIYNNKEVFFRKQGCGPLMVILPGNTASSICHQADMAFFSQDFMVAVLDYLGTGQSERVAKYPKDWFLDCAHQTAALIEYLGEDSAMLLGTSGGAVVALRTAAEHPEKVRAVIADSFTPTFSPQIFKNNVLRERSARSEAQVAFWQFAHGDDWESIIEADTQMLSQLAARGGDWLGDSLEKTTCPILFTASLADPMLLTPGATILSLLHKVPDGRAFISQKGQHPLIWTAPEEFRAAVQGFAARFKSD